MADVARAAESMPPIDHDPKPSAEVLLDQIQEFMDAMASQDPNDEKAVQNILEYSRNIQYMNEREEYLIIGTHHEQVC